MRVDADGTHDARCSRDITISNGLAWSPDGRTMYHADTPTHVVRAFDYDVATGTPSRPRACSRNGPARPTGPTAAAVDSAGNYWTRVLPRRQGRQDLAARRRRSPSIRCPRCARRCARSAGPTLRTLYVTSARQLRDADELARLPQSGGIFAMTVDVPGLARAALRRLTTRMHPRSRRLPAPRDRGQPRRDAAPARRSPRRPATCSRSPRTAGGAFRMRLGPNTRPDYGLLVGRARAVHDVRSRRRSCGRSPTATPRSRSAARRCASACCGRARRCFTSITDEHFRGWTRLPTFGRVAARRAVDGGVRARSPASPCTGSARSSARSTSAGSSSTRRSRMRSASTPGSRYKNTPFAWSPGTGSGAWGAVRAHAGHGDARRRASRLVASQLRGGRRRRGARPVPVRRRHARRHPRCLHRSSPDARPPVPRWSLGLWVSRAYYKTPEEAIDVARSCASGAFRATC